MTGNDNNTVESKLIFSAQIARRLLKMGNVIIDIKADRNDNKRTVFVFEKDEKFMDDFNTVVNDLADERAKNKSKAVKSDKKD